MKSKIIFSAICLQLVIFSMDAFAKSVRVKGVFTEKMKDATGAEYDLTLNGSQTEGGERTKIATYKGTIPPGANEEMIRFSTEQDVPDDVKFISFSGTITPKGASPVEVKTPEACNVEPFSSKENEAISISFTYRLKSIPDCAVGVR